MYVITNKKYECFLSSLSQGPSPPGPEEYATEDGDFTKEPMDIELEIPEVGRDSGRLNPKLQGVQRVKRGSGGELNLELAVVMDKYARQTTLNLFQNDIQRAVQIVLAVANGVQVSYG